LHQSLASFQSSRRFRSQLLSCFGRCGQKFFVRHYARHQSNLSRDLGVEGLAQQNQLSSTEVTAARRQGPGRSKLRDETKIDEGQLKLRTLARENKLAMCQQSSSASDSNTLHRCDQRLVNVQQRIRELSLRTLAWARWVFQEILQIVAGGE